jgi:hypothetical protein
VDWPFERQRGDVPSKPRREAVSLSCGANHVYVADHYASPSAPGYIASYGYDEKQQHLQPQQQYAPPAGPPATYQPGGPVQAQAPAEEEKKKGKFGKYGSMMAGSAAGGLGFGAGAAVGSGLINAIF